MAIIIDSCECSLNRRQPERKRIYVATSRKQCATSCMKKGRSVQRSTGVDAVAGTNIHFSQAAGAAPRRVRKVLPHTHTHTHTHMQT